MRQGILIDGKKMDCSMFVQNEFVTSNWNATSLLLQSKAASLYA
jgi:hypothetical protein